MGVVFVGGVYAVGKTTACAYAAQKLGLPHYSASSLIKAEKTSAIPDQGKVVADIAGNQGLLILGVNRALAEKHSRIILDGHFTLPDQNHNIKFIGVEVFRALSIERVIVYHDQPDAIAERLANRDGTNLSPSLITRHQTYELAHARHVCAELYVPLTLLPALDLLGLVDVIGP